MILQADVLKDLGTGLTDVVKKSDASNTSTIVFYIGAIMCVLAAIIVVVIYKQMRDDRKELIQTHKEHAAKMELLITTRNETMERVGKSMTEISAASAAIITAVNNNAHVIDVLQQTIINKLLK